MGHERLSKLRGLGHESPLRGRSRTRRPRRRPPSKAGAGRGSGSLSTVYDGPRGDILDAFHEARAVLRRARKGKVVSIEEFALAEDKIAGLIRRASEDTKQ